ncbi:hypothetical protein FRC08_010069 [Ceratobasidium sp. 394]|nr:hypothetical protein FRC08_010069 [Ceratobasidium sp. 394]KAG9079199.1 hypothetical protein FS749_008742 [Ceratobasidium sp. UAMH 11750]
MHVHPDLARVKDVVDGIVRTPLRYVNTLVMENLSISDSELVVGLLRHIHTVQKLSVLDCTFDAIVVQALADEGKKLLPELRELTVSGHEVGEEDIRALIEYRKDKVPSLERLVVRHCTRLTPEFVGWVESGAWL